MANNVIELVVQLKDRLTGPLQGVQGSLGKFKAAAVGLAAIAGTAKVLQEVVDNTVEAQNALAQLDVAFRNSAEAAHRSRRDILEFSEAALSSTAFADEAVTKAQTALLRFGRVTGETFSRAREDILDVSAALGIDLETAAFSVGRALEAPAQGLRQLRSIGVIFSADQQKLIQEPYAMGWDAAVNGPNIKNCDCALFSTPEKRQKWEEGKAAGERFLSKAEADR